MKLAAEIIDFGYTGLSKVISGGQWGSDRGGLEAAKVFNVKTGGTAPYGWRTSAGPAPELAAFGLTEHTSHLFQPRTKDNVINSDGTLIIASNLRSPGTILTMNLCHAFKKPFYVVNLKSYVDGSGTAIDEIDIIADFIEKNKICTLNVAGNRDYANRLGIINRIHEGVTISILNDLFIQLSNCGKLITVDDK
jgi:hypothetical protein